MAVRVAAPKPPERVLYIDAANQILGRLAAEAAKRLLEGYRVYIVNAEKAVVSGDPLMVIRSYKLWWEIKVHVNPYKWAPHRPRSPIAIVRKAVLGMLPRSKQKGREAARRLRVYIGVPEELKGRQFVRFAFADARRLGHKFIRVGELAQRLGWKGVAPRP
ncbi:50S ribosomal protein L13 [Pyrodictium occultum]|uniref:Large ribosomal subunit protein uL13 n=1 Tax=Pyrodictium occultum TaxID=2309 RepID=A0A0V8RTL7_PYROC|nr:50S ribosomal protein L13 [Pyrodictium occultum]KSW11409.1 50S ribosomal protein L13 [Pyrodictium occultum]